MYLNKVRVDVVIILIIEVIPDYLLEIPKNGGIYIDIMIGLKKRIVYF